MRIVLVKRAWVGHILHKNILDIQRKPGSSKIVVFKCIKIIIIFFFATALKFTIGHVYIYYLSIRSLK